MGSERKNRGKRRKKIGERLMHFSSGACSESLWELRENAEYCIESLTGVTRSRR